MRDRRAFLGTVGSALVAGLAGCSGSPLRDVTGDGTTPSGAGSADTTTSPGPGSAGSGANEWRGAYRRVYREASGSVVLVRTPGSGLGSGFVFDDEGHAVTNEHVVGDADRVELQFSRGESVVADVAGTDTLSDLAALDPVERPSYAEPLGLSESEPVVGTKVAVIGSPYALQGSLTSGVVSAVDRLIPNPRANFLLPNAIQTDAPVNPGNSGGPLVDLDGTVLGVVNSGGGENIAFAISPAFARRVVPELAGDGDYVHPYLGVRTIGVTDVVARANDLERPRGLLVVEVDPDGPAADVLRGSDTRTRVRGFPVPVGGDVILAIDGRRVETRQDLISYVLLEGSPGGTVSLDVLRNGRRTTVEVELAPRSGS